MYVCIYVCMYFTNWPENIDEVYNMHSGEYYIIILTQLYADETLTIIYNYRSIQKSIYTFHPKSIDMMYY